MSSSPIICVGPFGHDLGIIEHLVNPSQILKFIYILKVSLILILLLSRRYNPLEPISAIPSKRPSTQLGPRPCLHKGVPDIPPIIPESPHIFKL